MSGTCTYGTTFAWQRKKRTWLAAICAGLIALTGFSRNFLGVHTPQDVLVGFTVAVIMICVVGAAQEKLDGNEKILDILTLIGVLAIIGP